MIIYKAFVFGETSAQLNYFWIHKFDHWNEIEGVGDLSPLKHGISLRKGALKELENIQIRLRSHMIWLCSWFLLLFWMEQMNCTTVFEHSKDRRRRYTLTARTHIQLYSISISEFICLINTLFAYYFLFMNKYSLIKH